MIKDIVEKNDTITLENIHKEKLKEVISKFQDRNNNFDLENFLKYLNDEKVNVIREGYSLNFLGKRSAELQSALDSTTVFVPDEKHNNKKENINSENIYLSADNLEALRHLKKSYHGKIKCIYIDPPYNTGSDGFCYTDKFKYTKEELSEKIGIEINEAERTLNMESTQSNSHSAWLSFMYARLLIANELLCDDGVIFISIDDNEQSNLKVLCDEVFGEDNFVAICPRKTRGSATTKSDAEIQTLNDYVLIYWKNKSISKFNLKCVGEKVYPYNDERGDYYTVLLQDNGPHGCYEPQKLDLFIIMFI